MKIIAVRLLSFPIIVLLFLNMRQEKKKKNVKKNAATNANDKRFRFTFSLSKIRSESIHSILLTVTAKGNINILMTRDEGEKKKVFVR